MISSKVTFKVGGKEVSKSQLGEKMKEAAVEMVKDNLRARIEAVRCPIHNQNAKAIIKEGPADKLNYEIQGCCAALAEQVKKALGESG